MINKILSLISDTENFIQPFSGSLVLLNKEPSKIETINDPEGFITNFLRSFYFDKFNLINAKPNLSKLDLLDPFSYDLETAKLWLSKITNLELNEENITSIYNRLKRVRVCSGDWKRLTADSITYKNKGLSKTAKSTLLLDPLNKLNPSNIFIDQSKYYDDAKKIKSDKIQVIFIE